MFIKKNNENSLLNICGCIHATDDRLDHRGGSERSEILPFAGGGTIFIIGYT